MSRGSTLGGRTLRNDEIDDLRYGLRLGASAATNKRALQRLCELYEAGRRLQDSSEIRQMVHSHMSSSEVLVRRWAIKALALIAHRDDFRRLADRLKVEEDFEAQTWGMAGLVRNAGDRGLDELCAISGLPRTSAIVLAARLYAPSGWIARNAEAVAISLHDDDLTLKWATFLIGYDRAPEDLFDPRYSNELFLGELNPHDAPDVSEYSIWALWQRREFGARFSRIPLIEADRHPESVRKWLYRLAAQSSVQVGLDPDCLFELRQDGSDRAREGLALGVADLDPVAFGAQVLDWYDVEPNGQVRENLLASMAERSGEHADYADAVESRFATEQADSPLRTRLLAAGAGTPVYPALRAVAVRDERERRGLLEYARPTFILQENNYVNAPNVSIGGNLNAQNVAFGDMVDSANAAVQQLERSDQGAAQALQQVLAMLAASNVQAGRGELAAAVQQVAQAPSPESKKGLVERIKLFGAAASAAGTAVVGIDKVIDAVQALPF